MPSNCGRLYLSQPNYVVTQHSEELLRFDQDKTVIREENPCRENQRLKKKEKLTL